MKLSSFKAPNTYLFILMLTIFVAFLTWIIPGGKYISDPANEALKIFSYVSGNPQGISEILTAPIKGFIDAAQIIGFVLIVGGAFGVFQKTEALETSIKSLASARQKSRFLKKALIPLIISLFSLGGAVFGMSEEVIPFIMVFIPLALALGYDTYTGVAIAYVGAHTGFAAAFLNPFTIGIAQGIAEIPLFSGLTYRLIVWIVFTMIAVFYINWYIRKIEKKPESSLSFNEDIEKRKKFNLEKSIKEVSLETQHKWVLAFFAFAMLTLIIGVLQFSWYINEISALFLVTGIVVGIAGKLKVDDISGSFLSGAKDLIGTALIIALARGVLIIAKDGQIIDTILYSMATQINDLHPIVAGQAMFFIQTFINFFVPSGSGQAALTMPIMAPLADLIGVTRQTAVLAFQFGDGFSNMIIPTSPVLMGVLALAGIPYEKWFKWIIKLEIIFIIAACLMMIPPYFMNW